MRASLHGRDFHAWTQPQAAPRRAEKLADLDYGNLWEEIESLGARERSHLQSLLKGLVGHSLTWEYQPGFRSRNGTATIKEQRLSVLELLEDNPSLRNILEGQLRKAYKRGILLAVKETDLDENIFPETCHYTLEQRLNSEYYPSAQ